MECRLNRRQQAAGARILLKLFGNNSFDHLGDEGQVGYHSITIWLFRVETILLHERRDYCSLSG